MTNRQIAKKLHRTLSSVQSHRVQLGAASKGKSRPRIQRAVGVPAHQPPSQR
jgi:DNA-binding NarL/FixJ family response regulator